MIIHFNPKNKIEKKEKPKLTLNKVFYKYTKDDMKKDKTKKGKSKDLKKKKK